ncbi:hypothetical protein L211DRAFT_847382 [Terfezia boudieri ATCC MYA-4762]|uniref:Oxidoreductase acuF-like C2H2 type zinc-finger domain-containing protein n=1 Tax=Terfezia boudieri ATCC MYA-4762 TaxID=1051890 RepID=A0A3N4LTM3_9PEZI|nr:hypothetical protein L211DRAFT_847382 [Terfezia boudieri ATCC MYA-4762]
MGARVAEDNLRVQPPPNSVRAYEGAPFECSYCLYIITAPNFPAWQRHVFRDLWPFVSTFEECVTLNQLFKSRTIIIRDHLARHLQQLALCSLPRRQDLNSDVEDKTLDGAEEDEGTDRDRRVEDETPCLDKIQRAVSIQKDSENSEDPENS